MQMTLDGFTKGEICNRLGITQKTLWSWRKLPAWDEQLTVVLRGATEDGQGQIKSLLPLATRRLAQLISSPTETVALGAVRVALEAHITLVSREEQRDVVVELEAQLEELKVLAQQNQLPMAGEPVIDAEITPIAHADAHGPADPAPPVSKDGQ